jgi:hypothetical protein
VVVDRVRVGDQVALVAREQLVDAGAVVPRRVVEDDVPPGRHQHPEMPVAALLRRTHEHARRVRAEVRLRERVPAHRVDDRLGKIRQLSVPAADRRARELDAVAREDALDAVQRLVVLPAPHDRVGEQSRARKPALDRQLRHVGDQHLRRPVPQPVLARKLRPPRHHHDAGRRAALERLRHLLADPVELLETLLLHVERDQLDLDPREVLR